MQMCTRTPFTLLVDVSTQMCQVSLGCTVCECVVWVYDYAGGARVCVLSGG